MRKAAAVLIAVAGICYSSWVLEFLLPIHLDATDSFLSELDAVGQPYRDVFSTGDTITGSIIVVAGAAMLLLLPRRGWTTAGWIALIIFGASTIADANWPIGCIPTPQHPCPSEPSGLFPQLHHFHALTSSVAVNAIFVAMITFSIAAFRYRLFPVLRVIGLSLLILAAVTTAWMLIADNLSGDYQLGIAQRIQVGSMTLWLVALGVAVWLFSPRRVVDRP
ncbi:DUF998 domain-containing protein [Skermania sp. ID1734]|uniref:DUF998 domain-containing protein n=1 Tax=Skermania sp. ID1734 TaxID=2597516 RepID=UPI00118038DA|nr:DUF998 domain-containing protein [Skermania sp. ID1734]TSE00680.1 DUF998 domain-containing protein [Skermania sp. ID1734]